MKNNLISHDKRTMLGRGFLFYVLSVFVLSVQFVLYLLNGAHTGYMDVGGCVFFVTASISHAAILALFPFVFVIHRPGRAPGRYAYRTTHYDVAPTLMKEAMGVKNDPKDYSMGRLLSDTTFRNWHIVGDNLNFAFVVEDNVIIEKKPSGNLEIYDGHLNPLDDYKIKSKELNQAISELNKFYN
ncbi:MAG: hypothetical protein WCQ55_08785 [Paludibacteraceae bacterium]